MDSVPEQEYSKPESGVVSLNQEFMLFPPKRIRNIEDPSGDYPAEFHNRIGLETGGFVLPLEISATSHFHDFGDEALPKSEVVTPFTPEEGYIIDEEDFDPVSRQEKANRLEDQPIDLKKAPLLLSIAPPYPILVERGLVDARLEKGGRYTIYEWKPGVAPILQKLRIQLFFPNGLTYEGRPAKVMLEEGDLHFGNFLPLDIKSLPPLPEELGEAGFAISLPADLDQLSKIKAKFVFHD